MPVASAYQAVIRWIGSSTGASDSLMHVHAGLAVLLLARLVTGKSLATPVPFAIVCIAELANEAMDRIYHGGWEWTNTGLDILNTLFWPFVLMVGLRIRSARDGAGAIEKRPARPVADSSAA
jgi:hypothetical protein